MEGSGANRSSGGGSSPPEDGGTDEGGPGPLPAPRWARPESTDGPTTYSKGWGDGVRDALHYTSRLISRGHTAAEIKVFVESRLAHLDEEVALKRKTLTSAPSGVPVESLVRVQPRGSEGPSAFPPVAAGYNYLFLEEDRRVARGFVQGLLRQSVHGLAITRIPSDLRKLAPASQLWVLHTGVESSTLEGVEPAEYTVGGLTGKVDAFISRTPAPALLYVEAFEYLSTQNNFEIATRFLFWLHGKVQGRHGLLVASIDPMAFSKSQVATLERDFNHVVRTG